MKLGVAGLALVIGTTGCATSFEEARLVARSAPTKAAARDDAHCRHLADREAFWSSFAVATGALAGAGGVASIPIPDRYQPFSVGGVVLATVTAAGAKAYAHSLGVRWASECT